MESHRTHLFTLGIILGHCVGGGSNLFGEKIMMKALSILAQHGGLSNSQNPVVLSTVTPLSGGWSKFDVYYIYGSLQQKGTKGNVGQQEIPSAAYLTPL